MAANTPTNTEADDRTAFESIEDHMKSLKSYAAKNPILNHPEWSRKEGLPIWLRWREEENEEKQKQGRKYFGGILEDDEGFITTLKTVINLVVKQKTVRTSNRDYIKTYPTLIICPKSHMDHWAKKVGEWYPETLEVRKYCEPNPANMAARDLMNCDLVITAYEIISRELEELNNDEAGDEAATEVASNLPVLGKVSWKRIILVIPMSNETWETSVKDICKLESSTRWAVTEKEDGLMEIESLIGFLTCPPFDFRQMWEVMDANRSEKKGWQYILKEALCFDVSKDQMGSLR